MSVHFIDIAGKRFGRWTALRYESGSYWICRCDCGSVKRIFSGNLKNGKSRSCGCLRDEIVSACQTTHGLTKSAEYKVWAGIKRRCLNPNDRSFREYGGRGITICRAWSEQFESFLACVGKRPSDNHSIDRIDNSRGYEPGNCRWATRSQQMKNRRPLARERSGRVAKRSA